LKNFIDISPSIVRFFNKILTSLAKKKARRASLQENTKPTLRDCGREDRNTSAETTHPPLRTEMEAPEAEWWRLLVRAYLVGQVIRKKEGQVSSSVLEFIDYARTFQLQTTQVELGVMFQKVIFSVFVDTDFSVFLGRHCGLFHHWISSQFSKLGK
jgi:hypothetical protein